MGAVETALHAARSAPGSDSPNLHPIGGGSGLGQRPPSREGGEVASTNEPVAIGGPSRSVTAARVRGKCCTVDVRRWVPETWAMVVAGGSGSRDGEMPTSNDASRWRPVQNMATLWDGRTDGTGFSWALRRPHRPNHFIERRRR